MEDVARTVAQIFDESLSTLSDYVRIECLSPDFDADWQANGAIDGAAELLASWANGRDVSEGRVEVVRLETRTPVIFAELPGEEDRASTLIYGHLDKQPPFGPWRAGLDAFTPVRDGDRLYGRGTADDGYACFVAFAALDALRRHRVPRGRVVVLIEASEESGSPDLDAYLELLAPRIGTPGLVICLDSGCVSYDRLWMTTSLRGVLVGTLTVSVLTDGVHSGQAGGIVPSSFRVARELLSRIEDEHDGTIRLPTLVGPGLPPQRRDEIAAVAAAFGEAAAGLFPTVTGLALPGTPAARVAAGTWEPCLEVTGAAGFPEPEHAGNVLRPSTTLKLSLRLPPNVDGEAARQALVDELRRDPPYGAEVTVAFEVGQGWDAPPTASWLAAVAEAASLEHFGAPPASLGLGGSIPFMASLGQRFPDCQFLATGVLGPESNAHGPNEFLHLPTARRVGAVVAEVLAATP